MHIIIIMEVCKAPTLWLKALNKHNITHIMYIGTENVISKYIYTHSLLGPKPLDHRHLEFCPPACT